MNIVVSKFGGSSLADANCFRRVLDILARRSCRCYVVLSAPGKRSPSDEKITDLLVRAHEHSANGAADSLLLHNVRRRFLEIIRELKLPPSTGHLLDMLEQDVRHSPDRAASRGEYLCAQIFSKYADIPFVDAAQLIHFDENGRILPEKIRKSIRSMADCLPCAIIPGFYGAMPDGRIKTFTRGGSDITGALVAAALGADIYENWTDVDGLMSADPRVCPNALCHPAISYRQMRQLARSGAQVLHPYCLEPVSEAGIPTNLRNTFHPDLPGTYISDAVRNRVPCICCRKCKIAALESFSDETCSVIAGLGPDLYYSMQGSAMVALNSDSIGTPACLLTAFGMPEHLRNEAIRSIHPIAFFHQDDHSRYLIASDHAESAARSLHRLLLGR